MGREFSAALLDDLDSWPPAYLLIIVFTTEYVQPPLFLSLSLSGVMRSESLNWK
jgi:hypothetical protein